MAEFSEIRISQQDEQPQQKSDWEMLKGSQQNSALLFERDFLQASGEEHLGSPLMVSIYLKVRNPILARAK